MTSVKNSRLDVKQTNKETVHHCWTRVFGPGRIQEVFYQNTECLTLCSVICLEGSKKGSIDDNKSNSTLFIDKTLNITDCDTLPV